MTKTVKFAFAAGLLMMMSTMLNAQAGRKADKDTEEWRYEIECAGTGAEGTYLIKVWSFSKKPQVAMEQCKKNAVHGVVFKGFGGGQGCTSQKPLARSTNADEQFERYFENFFADGGSYMKYRITSYNVCYTKLLRYYRESPDTLPDVIQRFDDNRDVQQIIRNYLWNHPEIRLIPVSC